MDELRTGMIDAIRQGRGYGYVAENYWKLSTNELKEICLELLYAVDTQTSDREYILESVADSIADLWEEA